MSSAGFIYAINFFVGGLFALLFGLISSYGASYRSARWFAFAFACGMLDMALEFALPFSGNAARIIGVAIFASYLMALMLGVIGLSRRFRVLPPFVVLIPLFIVSIAVNALISGLPRDSIARLFLYQTPYFLAESLGAYVVLRFGGKQPVERVLGVFLTLSSLNYLAKPFIAWAVGGSGATAQDYAGSAYALFSQTIGTILSLALGVLFVLAYLQDILADMKTESETDRLSGLLNRRGFETRVKALIKTQADRSAPASFVICDIDHFKRINDAFGHAVGDEVIVAFSGMLARHASQFVVGRIGGEEFGIFMPAGNLAMVRLFAEAIRTTSAHCEVKDLPSDWRVTASFGVAEMMTGETYASLLRRADMALYKAKRDGRNRVRAAPFEAGEAGEPDLASGLPLVPESST